jgi:hypothetical protein
MVIHYTETVVNELFKSEEYMNNYLTYRNKNIEKIKDLNYFFNSLDINKKYYKMNISSKNKKFKNNLSNQTLIIKYINNELNKVTENNIDETIVNINQKILENKTLLPVIIDTIINKSIYQLQYMDFYISILISLLNIDNINITILIDKKYNEIFNKQIILEDTYDNLCKVNKNIDASIGISIFIIKLELKNIISNYIDNIIDAMINFINENISNNDITYKYILSLYNIFLLLDKSYINKYTTHINKFIENKNINKKNKFKLMDIIDLKIKE